jgi:hypothetical protein
MKVYIYQMLNLKKIKKNKKNEDCIGQVPSIRFVKTFKPLIKDFQNG